MTDTKTPTTGTGEHHYKAPHNLRYPTRLARVITALLDHPTGISGREIDFKYNINSGRNEANDLINDYNIDVHKEDEPNQYGTGYYTVYSLPNRTEAAKVIKVLNFERTKCHLLPLSEAEAEQYLIKFKE